MAEHCRTWDGDAAWGGRVPLGLYAQAVHSVCGFVLSEEELRQLLRALHPEVGEPPGGKAPCLNRRSQLHGPFLQVRLRVASPPASASQPPPAPARGWPHRVLPGHTGPVSLTGKLLREQPFDYKRLSRAIKVRVRVRVRARVR